MSAFVRFLGSLLIFAWFASMMIGADAPEAFPEPYGSLLLSYKWGLLVAGIIFIIWGSKSWKREQEAQNKESVRDGIIRKDFHAVKREHQSADAIPTKSFEKQDLALKVDWYPLASGGANFKTSQLVKVNSSRLEVANSTGAFLFASVFIAVGLVVFSLMTYSLVTGVNKLSWAVLAPLLFSGVFASVGALFLYFPRPRVFDKKLGWFWVGNKSIKREQAFLGLKKSARLAEIDAIQIITEHVRGGNSSYTSWEINLVSADAQRLNVMDHGNKTSILKDAKLLGEFLNVPIWENS